MDYEGGERLEAREIEQCIDRFGTDVYHFCMRLCADRSDADDLYQQTFLKALESPLTLDWEQNPKAFFFSIACNIWKTTMRKTARRNAIAPSGALDDKTASVIGSGENIEENFLKQELLAEISRIIAGMPDRLRLPVTLFYQFDFPLEQIAKTLKLPAGTVKSRLSRGRDYIRKKLKEAGYHEEA